MGNDSVGFGCCIVRFVLLFEDCTSSLTPAEGVVAVLDECRIECVEKLWGCLMGLLQE